MKEVETIKEVICRARDKLCEARNAIKGMRWLIDDHSTARIAIITNGSVTDVSQLMDALEIMADRLDVLPDIVDSAIKAAIRKARELDPDWFAGFSLSAAISAVTNPGMIPGAFSWDQTPEGGDFWKKAFQDSVAHAAAVPRLQEMIREYRFKKGIE